MRLGRRPELRVHPPTTDAVARQTCAGSREQGRELQPLLTVM